MDLFKTNEILKKTCFDLEYEEEIVDNFLELVEIMDLIVTMRFLALCQLIES